MPSLELTIEENSPLISYFSDWSTGESSSDNVASSYSESSFMATQAAGASASFVFNGTGVRIFGAKRGNHGAYNVKVDDTTYPTQSGLMPDPGLFQQNLFSVNGLQQGRHEVTIINQGKTFLDIDFITWFTELGKPSDKVFVNTYQDSGSSFVYSSGSAVWNTNPKNVGGFLGGSGHVTTNTRASFVYTFQAGEGVSLYGPVSPDGAPYTVQLDGGSPQNFSATKRLYKSQVLLYHANNLSPGKHQVKFTCQPSTSGQSCAIDYANVYTTTPPQSAKEGGLSTGSIVGITISIVGIFAVLAGLYLFLRRNHRQMMHHDELSRSYATEKASNDARPRAVTISSFGPGPLSGDINTVQNLIPSPFQSSATPSISSRPGWPNLARPGLAKKAFLRAKPQTWFSGEAEQRDNGSMPSQTPSRTPPGLRLEPIRRPSSSVQRPPTTPDPEVPARNTRTKAQSDALRPVNGEQATSEQNQRASTAPRRESEERAQPVGNIRASPLRSSLVSVPPDYQWATRMRPYSGL